MRQALIKHLKVTKGQQNYLTSFVFVVLAQATPNEPQSLVSDLVFKDIRQDMPASTLYMLRPAKR